MPVAQLLLSGRRSQPHSLPLGEMPVLCAKLGHSGGCPLYAAHVERLELFPEQSLRPSVRDKLMKLDHKRVVVFTKPQ